MIYDSLKRLLDVVGAAIGLLITAPILLIACLAIRLDSKGPILADTPMRVGKKGQLFKMYKFRSMVIGAYDLLQKNQDLLKKYKQNSYKLSIEDDPRITKVGKFIRKYSIDELPQLLIY